MNQPNAKTLAMLPAPLATRKKKFRRRSMNTWQERRYEYLRRVIQADPGGPRVRQARKEAEELSRILYQITGISG